jgi:hypothetical protein
MANLLRQRQMGLNEDAALRDKWAFDQAKEQAALVKQQREADTLVEMLASNGQQVPDDVFVNASENGRKFARDAKGQLEERQWLTDLLAVHKQNKTMPTQRIRAAMNAARIPGVPIEWDADKVFQNQQTLQSALPELKKRGDALGVDVTKLPAWIIANSEGNLDGLLDVDKELTARQQQEKFAAGLGVFQQTGDASGLLGPGVLPQNTQLGIVQGERAAATNLAKMGNDNQAFVDQLVARGVPRKQAEQIASLPASMRGELSAIDKTNADAAAKLAEEQAKTQLTAQQGSQASALAMLGNQEQQLGATLKQMMQRVDLGDKAGNAKGTARELTPQIVEIQRVLNVAAMAKTELEQLVKDPQSKNFSDQQWSAMLPRIKQQLGLTTGRAFSDSEAIKWALAAMGESPNSP